MRNNYEYVDPDYLYTDPKTRVLRNRENIDNNQLLIAFESLKCSERLEELAKFHSTGFCMFLPEDTPVHVTCVIRIRIIINDGRKNFFIYITSTTYSPDQYPPQDKPWRPSLFHISREPRAPRCEARPSKNREV